MLHSYLDGNMEHLQYKKNVVWFYGMSTLVGLLNAKVRLFSSNQNVSSKYSYIIIIIIIIIIKKKKSVSHQFKLVFSFTEVTASLLRSPELF